LITLIVEPIRVEFENPVLHIKVLPKRVEYVILITFTVDPIRVEL